MVSNNGRPDFLGVSWQPAVGDVDSYLVLLKDRDRTVHNLVVSKASPECVFNSLKSGRLYTVSIATRSGSFQNNTVVTARTRRSHTHTNTHTHASITNQHTHMHTPSLGPLILITIYHSVYSAF